MESSVSRRGMLESGDRRNESRPCDFISLATGAHKNTISSLTLRARDKAAAQKCALGRFARQIFLKHYLTYPIVGSRGQH
jgi:hypothetical protein